MAWRNIIISQTASLTYKQNNLIVKLDDNYQVPIEDIATVMIENNHVTITSTLLTKLAENNVVIYFCDNKHLPNGIFLPINNHSRHLKMIQTQLNITLPFKKRLWQKIIKQKIYNQSTVLELINNESYKKLLYYQSLVKIGDIDNIESIAANYYFKSLFGNKFSRTIENNINASLNYGYSILRGAIARSIAIYGFLPVMGINHHSELNNFNLVDDIIEPYRQIVDLWTYININSDEVDFNTEHKHSLYDLLNYNIEINNQKQSVLNSIDLTVKSLVTSYNSKDYNQLLLPKLIDLQKHKYE